MYLINKLGVIRNTADELSNLVGYVTRICSMLEMTRETTLDTPPTSILTQEGEEHMPDEPGYSLTCEPFCVLIPVPHLGTLPCFKMQHWLVLMVPFVYSKVCEFMYANECWVQPFSCHHRFYIDSEKG